jgi:hypothetical protein
MIPWQTLINTNIIQGSERFILDHPTSTTCAVGHAAVPIVHTTPTYILRKHTKGKPEHIAVNYQTLTYQATQHNAACTTINKCTYELLQYLCGVWRILCKLSIHIQKQACNNLMST